MQVLSNTVNRRHEFSTALLLVAIAIGIALWISTGTLMVGLAGLLLPLPGVAAAWALERWA